uniref:Uncharacterized protein n=1 Tax=Oryza punctata TaxID=4537 RepID=A0A0E0JSU0_ORYPU
MPDLHKPKRWPFSLFVPSNGVRQPLHHGDYPNAEARFRGQHSDQFEVFVYRKNTTTSSCQLLIPPPFVRDPNFSNTRTKITSYAVVSGGSEICISVQGAGTYCLDIAKHSWRHVGEWTLPFNGKVEYVPELKLWFGLSAETKQMAAADLSTMDSQPELLVNLGSGRFCIARFFYIRNLTGYYHDHITEDHFAVLTGVDVVPCTHDSSGSGCANANANGSGEEVKLRMINFLN